MKTIISYFAIAVMLLACSKTESPGSSDQLSDPDSSYLKGGMTVTTHYFSAFITYHKAKAGGKVQTNGDGHNVIERGICYSKSTNPTIEDSTVVSGSGSGVFECKLKGLKAATTYYIRAYATKKNGVTKYGDEKSFSTLIKPVYGTVTDYDGNEYVTLTAGTQTWMMENLKVTHYSNGDEIPNVTDGNEWRYLYNEEEEEDKGAWCDYNNDVNKGALYGHLYNWYAATDSRNIAPDGWHVPTRADWETLQAYLGVENGNPLYIPEIGKKLKEKGTDHWTSPNKASNVSRFTVLPGGYRSEYGNFNSEYYRTYLWSSGTYGSLAYYRMLFHDHKHIGFNPSGSEDLYRTVGAYVRCVKD